MQANYEGGLRVLRIDNIANENGNELEEIAYFDMYPWKTDANGSAAYDEIKFFGAWSSFPYFNELGSKPDAHRYSNKVIVQSTTTGLYVLEFSGGSMDFSVDSGEDSDSDAMFSWDSWYGYTLVIVAGILCFFSVFVGHRYCCGQASKKDVGVYESIIGMEENAKYGTARKL